MVDRSNFEPLYLQIKNDILQKIEAGEIAIGDKLMSESEMMQYYSVGRVTVRAALAELVSEGCVRKENGFGSVCVGLPHKNALNIDVLVENSNIYFTPYLLKGIGKVLEQNSCNLLLHDTYNSNQRIKDLLRNILLTGSDGVLCQPSNQDPYGDEELLQLLNKVRASGIPLVLFCGVLKNSDCTKLYIDDSYGSNVAAKYLLACGHRRILGLFAHDTAGFRTEGFLSAIETEPTAKAYLMDWEEGCSKELLRLIRENNITAIQCVNDLVATECMHLLDKNNISVPDDVSVIGFDNVDIPLEVTPSLTTVSHPKSSMGSDAARMLLQQIQSGEQTSCDVIYRPELVIRQSVKVLK